MTHLILKFYLNVNDAFVFFLSFGILYTGKCYKTKAFLWNAFFSEETVRERIERVTRASLHDLRKELSLSAATSISAPDLVSLHHPFFRHPPPDYRNGSILFLCFFGGSSQALFISQGLNAWLD